MLEEIAGIEMQLSDSAPLGPLPWFPLEVLELERWKELTNVDNGRGYWGSLLYR